MRRWAAVAVAVSTVLGGCGGGSNPLGNPESVSNPAGTFGRRLSFAYFQACVQPVLITPLPIRNGSGSNTCAAAGCHDTATGTGGALRLSALAQAVPAGTAAEATRATEMYRNFYSAQGETVPGAPESSLLLAKPRLAGVLHGGGLIFEGSDDNVRRIETWIRRPMPQGEDEFSAAAATMFGPAGQCLTP